MKSAKEYSVFVSYASEARTDAERICASLEARGFVCWIAPRDVRAGREYADEIISGLERSACVVLVLCEAANTSVFVRREVERAVSKQKPIFPVRTAEVLPSPGLELFISGTQWIDAWAGNWDAHMDRLARDLADGPVGGSVPPTASKPRPVPEPRSLRAVYAVVGLVLFVAAGGIAIWSSRGEAPEKVDAVPATREVPQPAPAQNRPPTIAEAPREQPVVPSTEVVRTPPLVTRPARTLRPAPSTVEGPRELPADPPPPVENPRELRALVDAYDDLSDRGGAIDDTLNRLWEDMKPASPRVDMVTHQRSLKANLMRSKAALAQKDAVQAKRHLEIAREDLEALERFLNR